MKRRLFLKGGATAAGVAMLAPHLGFAEAYPSRVIRIVASNSAGTPPDILARVAANGLAEGEGWKVIVENKPGGIGSIAANEVLKQESDGYTLFSMSGPLTAAPALLPNASFSLERDFAPVVHFATGYNVLVVTEKLPVHSVSELVEFLRRSPDKHTFSSGGFGTPAHLLGEAFKLQAGVKTMHVPYSNFPQAIADLIGGVNSYQFITALPALQHIKSGALRALAVMSAKRITALRDVPTIVEAGYPTLEAEDWVGFVVKSGTSPTVIARLNGAMNKALKNEKVRQQLAGLGVDVGGGTPDEFGARVRAEGAFWAKVIREAKIKIHS